MLLLEMTACLTSSLLFSPMGGETDTRSSRMHLPGALAHGLRQRADNPVAVQVTLLLVGNNALQGILSSFFFKYADTILKKYSSTVATIFTGGGRNHPLKD